MAQRIQQQPARPASIMQQQMASSSDFIANRKHTVILQGGAKVKQKNDKTIQHG